jgi:hypothetical protein
MYVQVIPDPNLIEKLWSMTVTPSLLSTSVVPCFERENLWLSALFMALIEFAHWLCQPGSDVTSSTYPRHHMTSKGAR